MFHSLYGKKLGLDENNTLRHEEGSVSLDSGTKTATATGTGATGTATLNKVSGKITTGALTTAAAATHVLTLTNSKIAAADQVYVSVGKGTATTGTVTVADVLPGAGSVVITIQNIHASAAVNGTLVVAFMVVKA
ncbi:hypothetical protein LB542_19790 [Mesorhizobium sp. BR1-1-9]|uniref:hypothetical protein n=1 Tax=Mesorhizobium sp. BR1-1-9 TaxID=2876646 RepID=UPI001CD0A550|nr:hypothetical protein [Mesorhizobium sp. BR1-1-9]MBZ9873093.1 hypothetical protein [Mesorhizobium sp. BR1-1-9]